MKRATVGVWLNYATTAVFQVAFAINYGGGTAASVFILTFSLVLFIGGIPTACTQALLVPRLLTQGGQINRKTLAFVGVSIASTAVLMVAVAATASGTSPAIASIAHLPARNLLSALPAGCLFMFFNVVAMQIMFCLLALGRRFGPAAAPVFPSLAGTLAMLMTDDLSPARLLLAMTLGASIEIVFLAALIPRPVALGAAPLPGIAKLSVFTGLQFVFIAALPFVDRLLAGLDDPSGVAHFNYASRSLGIAQQLLIGGAILAVLGRWSSMASRLAYPALHRAISRTFVAGLIVLASAAAVGLVLAEPLTKLIYQHGEFSATDTAAVAGLIALALPGFLAEGLSSILSQALLATRRSWAAIALGICNVVLRVAFAVSLAVPFGVKGVAVAYSISTVVVLAIQITVLQRRGQLSITTYLGRARLVTCAVLTIGASVGLHRLTWGNPWIRAAALTIGLLLVYRVPAAAVLRDRREEISTGGLT